MARDTLHWDRPFHTIRSGSFENGDIVWFPEGGLNASYNCVDRWAFKHPDKVRYARSLSIARALSRHHPERAVRVYSPRNQVSVQYVPRHPCMDASPKICPIALRGDAMCLWRRRRARALLPKARRLGLRLRGRGGGGRAPVRTRR